MHVLKKIHQRKYIVAHKRMKEYSTLVTRKFKLLIISYYHTPFRMKTDIMMNNNRKNPKLSNETIRNIKWYDCAENKSGNFF